jgi:hypothetical protein
MVTLVDLLSSTYAPVQTMILPYLDVASVTALTRTCKGFDQLQPILKATAYNINHQLRTWFKHPDEFRSFLGQCRGLIFSTFARRFMSRLNLKDSSLDIVLEGSADDCYQMRQFLLGQGYASKPPRDDEYPGEMFWQEEMEVNVWYSERAAIAWLFKDAVVTAELNVISWNAAYSLFPCSTFIKKDSFMLRSFDEGDRTLLAQLTREGLKSKTASWFQQRIAWPDLVGNRDYNHLNYHDTMTRRRRIGDKYTWKLNLDVTGVVTPDMPTKVLESTTFRLYPTWRGANALCISRYRLDFDENIRHPVLQYQYVTLAEDSGVGDGHLPRVDDIGRRDRRSHYSRRCDELIEYLDETTMLELAKIPANLRPPQYSQLRHKTNKANDTRGKFTLPDSWTFYDDDVIAFLDRRWNEQQEIDEWAEAIDSKHYLDSEDADEEDVKQLLKGLLKAVKVQSSY